MDKASTNYRDLVLDSVKNNKIFDQGWHTIYRLPDGILAKHFNNILNARKEYNIGKILYDSGVNVPRYHSFIWGLTSSYVVMDEIEGVGLGSFTDTDLSFKHGEQISKAWDAGLEPVDAGSQNAILENETGKVYLIDFEKWKFQRNFAHRSLDNLVSLRQQYFRV